MFRKTTNSLGGEEEEIIWGKKAEDCFTDAYGKVMMWTKEERMQSGIRGNSFTIPLDGVDSDAYPEHYLPAPFRRGRERSNMEKFRECMGLSPYQKLTNPPTRLRVRDKTGTPYSVDRFYFQTGFALVRELNE